MAAMATNIAACPNWSINYPSWRKPLDSKSSFISGSFLTTSPSIPKSIPLKFGAGRAHLSSFWPPFACSSRVIVAAVNGEGESVERNKTLSPWDDKPFVLLPDGTKSYLDEQDVAAYLEDPMRLTPYDPSSYNPAAYLWKKISDIPEDRRHRLLYLLKPEQIAAAWAVGGARYDHPKLSKRSSSRFLTGAVTDNSLLEHWNCCKSGGPMPFALLNEFKMVLFNRDGQVYGRFLEDSFLGKVATSFSPLYFTVHHTKEVMPTEQPCDLAFEFGDGLLDITDIPEGFVKPAKHPQPFDDQVVVYIRYVGPGVMVGQAWREGLELEQVPKKLCGEILMVKDYRGFS